MQRCSILDWNIHWSQLIIILSESAQWQNCLHTPLKKLKRSLEHCWKADIWSVTWWLWSFNYQMYDATLWFRQTESQREVRCEKNVNIYIFCPISQPGLTCPRAQIRRLIGQVVPVWALCLQAMLTYRCSQPANRHHIYTHLAAGNKHKWRKPAWNESRTTRWAIWMQQQRQKTIQTSTTQTPEALWLANSSPGQPQWTQMISFCNSGADVTDEVLHSRLKGSATLRLTMLFQKCLMLMKPHTIFTFEGNPALMRESNHIYYL